ncbi:unnamed protein product [Sphagnum tenellum]
MLRAPLVLLFVTATVSAVQIYPVRFPEETYGKVCDDGDDAASNYYEKATRDRAARAIEACYSFGDFLSPESKTLGWNHQEIPAFGEILVFDRIHPAFQACSPRNAWGKYSIQVYLTLLLAGISRFSDNFPTFVLKGDDKQRLAAEMDVLQEIFGLEELDFPVNSIDSVPESMLKVLYSQLSAQEVDDLADFYHVDFQTYQYSPKNFYFSAN